MDELEKLFNALTRDGYYTKSFEEFQTQYNDPVYRDKVFGVVSRDGLFTKTREEFDLKYVPSGVETEIQEGVPVKKKDVSEDSSFFGTTKERLQDIVKNVTQDGSESVSEDISSESPSGDVSIEETKEFSLPGMQSLNEKIGFEPTKEAVVEEFGETATIAPTLPIKEQYETYNLAAASKSPTPDFTIYEDYLPAGVKEIPTAEQVIEGEYNAVVPFDQAAYERNKDAYRIIYDNKVKDYEVYLKNNKGYIKADDGRYYSPDKFDSETILNKELSLISEYNIAGKAVPIMDEPNEAIYTYWKDKLEKFGFDLKYNPSAIGTSITVVSSHTGERTGIDLDTWGDDADRRQVEKLKTFVKNNFDEDGVEQKDLIESLSSETRASMGGPTESRYKTVPKGRVISDAEVDIEGIDAALKVAKKNLEEAEALPDVVTEIRSIGGPMSEKFSEVKVANKKKSQKIAQAKQQIKNLEGESVKAQDRLTSAKEGKTQKANAFASEVLSGQVATETERLEAQGLENRYKYKVSQGVAKKLEDAYQRAKELEDEYHTPEGWINAEAMAEYNSISKEILPDVKTYSELVNITQESIDTYQVDRERLRQDVGRKVIMDAEMGGVGSSIVRALVSGAGGVAEGFVETIFGDAYANINNLFYNEYEEGYLTDAERKEIKKDSIQDDWVSSVDRSLGITEESAEAYRKNLSYEDMIKNLAYIGPDGQTKDVMEGGNVLTEGLYGLLESMPAMATSIINPGAAVISFASMGINGINKEMESNPMFDNVSENEKLLITLPYGIVMGVLENYGFRNALSNSSLIGKIMMNSLKKSKKAGSRSFRELVVDEIENKVLKVGILTASSAAAEFETGATQQVFEAYIKEGYDVAKGQDYFKQSIDLLNDKYITKEFVGEVWRAGLAEAVGGFAMGAAPAISTAVRENKIAEIPIGRFIVLEKAMLDPTLRKVAKMRLDEDVAMGMKTREDADAEFQDFNITLGQMRAIPQEFDIKSKQQILALESQKKEIGDRIEGKSKFTTREEQRQIKVLEERIEEISAKAKKNIPENQARYEEAKTNDGFEGTINEFLNKEILAEELFKVIEKSPENEAPTKSTTEVASEPDIKEVTDEQLDEVRDLEEESKPVAETVVEKEVATEEAPVTKEEQDAKDKARAEKLAELDRNLREATTEKAPVAETQEVVEDGKVPEVTQEKQDRYNNKEMSDEEIKDVLIGLNTKVQMRADGKTEEKITAFERKIKNENETLFREVIGMRPAPKTETKTDTPKKKTPKKEVKVETPKKEYRTYYVFANPDTGLYEVIDNTSPTNQPVIKTYKTESGADNFVSKLTTAQGRVRFVDEAAKKEAPKKEAPKKDTGVDAKLRAIAVKMDKAAKEKVSSNLTKADRELIKKNTKRFKEISDEVKMPTTTADGIRSAITMIEDSFKDKESKIKEQIKRIDARVSDRMTKDKDRKKKKDELSKARKEKNARVKELKAKLTDMGAKFRLSDDVAAESPEGFITEDDIVEGMKKLGPVEKGFKIPSGIKEGDVDPIAQSKSTKKITDAQAKKLGFESVSDMLKNIQEFNSIPMIVAMSDVLASGVAKDSMGKKMKVDGGLLYNILGSNTELAWAGVNETGANTQYTEALDLYRANKELFDRLWKEGKLPQNHVPMVVLRMGNSAINSNEAMFRYLAPLIKSFPKQNQDEAFTVLMESIEGKKNVSQENKSGRDTVKSAEQLEEVINKNNITDVGSLFDFIVKDAKKRAKGDGENTIPLPTRALLFDLVVSPVGVKKPSKGVAKALIKDTQSEGKEFLADKILSDIGETSMMESESGDAVAIMGVDVINGGVRKANHNNYGFGPKGRLIALIKNPMNGLDIFPEWRAKAVRVFKKDAKGEMPTLEKVLRQVGGAFFIDKAFRGARVQTEQSDIDVISGKMRFAFPGVSVSQTQQEFDEALKQEGIRTAESNGNTILGLTKDGKIFLNPSRKSLSTPIHEFGHIWIDFLRSESSKTKGTKLLKKGLELVEGTKALESAIKKYGDNELAREEALVELMGTKGETIANAAKRAKFIEWFNAFFKYIKEKLTRFKDVKVKDIKDISLEDFVDIGLAELFSGQAVDKESDVKFKPEEAATSAKARMQMEDKGVDLKGAIEKVIARARAKEISDNVIIAYLMQDKGFDRKKALATIKRVNRKNLRSAIKSLFASVKDITNISEQEAELVKELLKYDRATTRADKAIQKKAKEELLAQVKVMARVSKGKISAAQLSAVISKLSRVNLSRQSSIDNFVDYMRKVFGDADYAQKLTGLKSKIKQAKKNIRTKVGIGQDGLTYELENLLNIDPSIIPDDVFTKYEKLVTSFGAKKTVLSLPEATQVKQDIAEINDALNTQNSLVGELTERFNSFEDKKTTEDGKVEYAATVKRMLKDKVITEEEAKLMTKFSKEINPREEREGKSEEQKEMEMEEEKKGLIQEVKDSDIDTSGITNRLAKQVAESLSEMIKTEAINELSNPQLKNLIKAIDNVNSGYVNHYSQLAWENLMSTNFAKTATEAVKKAKPLPLSRAFAKLKSKFTGRTDIYTMIERTPLFYMDTVLGDFASKDIFNSILKDPAAALAAYQSASKQLYEKLDAVENSLMRAYKRNGNKIIESKYKQMAYMIQLEHESNPDSKETKPASQIMEATIQSLYDSNQKRNAEVLEKILKEYSDKDGNIDLKKLKDSFKPVENKMIKVVQEVNSELTEKAVFTAAIIRGEAIDPLNNYVHHQVLSSDGSTMDNVDKLSESVVNNTKPSTKAKNLIERVSKVSPINFDILSATKRGAKMTLIDYHLTSPLRVANKTLNKVQDSLPNKGEQREIFNGIRDGYNQAIKDVLSDNFSSNTFGADIDNFILKAGYRTMLVGGRFVSELLSNMLFAMKNPTIIKAGMTQRKVAFSAIGPKVVQNLKSPNQNRLYPEGLSGKLVDQELLSQAKGTGKAVQGKSKFVNVAAQVGSYATDNMTTRGLVALADKMISTPDMLATRTVWFGNFTTEFKKLTGQEVDFNKIAENDAEYMSKFKKELAQATKTADREAVLIGATDNPLMGILKNKKRAEDSGFVRLFKNFNGFMQKFLVFEFNAFRIGVQSAIGRGEISSIEGGKLLAAALIRMTSYVVVTPLVSDLVVSTIGGLIGVGDDDDEEEKKKRGSLEQQVARGVASSAVTLLSGSGGAGVKSILNFGTEYINKNYGAELGFRDKDIEYDPFLNSIAFNIVPEQKEYGSPNLAEDFVPRVAGAYAPFYNTANLSYKLLTAPELKEDDAKERRRREVQERLPLEVLGQLGLVPFYKEARKAVLKDIYKDVGKKKKSSGSKGGQKLPKLPKLGKLPKLPKLPKL